MVWLAFMMLFSSDIHQHKSDEVKDMINALSFVLQFSIDRSCG